MNKSILSLSAFLLFVIQLCAQEKTVFVQDNLAKGQNIKRDSLGRITDSAVYDAGMLVYLVRYAYNTGGERKTVHEFTNEWPSKWPDVKSTVITADGMVLGMRQWRDLLQTDRYGFRQDKITANKYLVVRYSDDFFNKMVARDPKPTESKSFTTGQDFYINEKDINGNRLKSEDLKGKILVINYWYIHCPPCRAEIPELNKIVQEYKDSANVKFIAICLDGEPAIHAFLKQQPFQYQVVANGLAAAHRYNINAYPTHVIVDGAGKVYFHTVSTPRQLFYWIRKSVNELSRKQLVNLL